MTKTETTHTKVRRPGSVPKPPYIFTSDNSTKESVGAIVSVYPLVTTPPIIQADTPTRIVDVIACRARIGIRCSE